ncbi:MAG: TlpA disulfide reductase family protein [Chitinophagaceae bacterium]
MKKNFLLYLSLLSITLAQAQVNDTLQRKELDALLKQQPVDSALVRGKLQKLVASNNERNWILAERYYYELGDKKTTDSLQKEQAGRFPLGYAARSNGAQAIYGAATAEEAEKLYKEWIAKFPPSRFPNVDHDHIAYDYVTSAIANRYAQQKNTDKALEYIEKLEEEFWKGNGYGGISSIFHKNGDLPHAESYAKKAMESAKLFLDATDGAGKFAAFGYPGLTNTYIDILTEEKKYDEALKCIDTLYQTQKTVDSRTNFTYAKLLILKGRNSEAFDKLDAAMKTGKATPAMDSTFQLLYVKVKGSNAGYDDYMAAIRQKVHEQTVARLQKEIFEKPAPLFTLTDVNGNKVSLAQFKGKTVVLDFWATWCGPCKRSFPAMKMAQDKYKNDPNVKFLFIHTWERDGNATASAKAYVQNNNYDFEVLMDLKDPETKENKVVLSYGVSGIPAKFVIDPKGNIRFHLTGFDGSNEAAVDELSSMIELARKG